MHPFVLGELALGSIGERRRTLEVFRQLLQVVVAAHDEVLTMIETEPLFGRGIGYIDAHVLASVRLTTNTQLWTRDRSLRRLAIELAVDSGLD